MEANSDNYTGIVPGYGQFGDEHKAVWRVFIDGRQVGIWTKRRWARQDFRRHIREAGRARQSGTEGSEN